jgi:VanZ family protein
MRQRTMKWRAAIVYWLPAAALMFVMYGLSSQPASKQDIKPMIREMIPAGTVNRILPNLHLTYGKQNISLKYSEQAEVVEFIARKSAHVLLYTTLGILLARAWQLIVRNRTGAAFAAWVSSALFATSDEWHQLHVPFRTGRPADICLDMIGASTGILLYILTKRRVRT